MDEFVTQYGLDDLRDLLRKGALLVHFPEKLQFVEYLSHDEITALENEAVEEQAERPWPLNENHDSATVFKSSNIGGMVLYVAIIISFSTWKADWPISLVLSGQMEILLVMDYIEYRHQLNTTLQ